MTEAIVRSSRERIQRSSTCSGAGVRSRLPVAALSRINRLAFQSLLARAGPAGSSRPSSARPGSRTSRAGRSEARRAPLTSIPRAGRSRCRGSSTSAARRAPGSPSGRRRRRRGRRRRTRGRHHHPRDPEEDDLARRGQEVGRVEGAQLGRVVGPAERGERPERELNQVSRTSVSWRSSPSTFPQRPGSALRPTIVSSHASQYQTGIRCPHQSWREMHQWRISRIQSR